MDETTLELVSRHADGDLDDAESSRLEVRAESDPELAAEIDDVMRLRVAVRTIADRMEPPAELDSVMEPLRQAPPGPAQRARPVFRWLGIAAAMVVGVTVATEMARRNPSPTQARPSIQQNHSAEKREEIFKLAPLPTAVPREGRPLGVADHLLEEEPVAPAAPEPAPLEVMGPLNAPAPSVSAAELNSALDALSTDEDVGPGSRPVGTPGPAAGKKAPVSRDDRAITVGAEAELMRREGPTDGHRETKAGSSAVGGLSPVQPSGRPQSAELSVDLLIDDVIVWTGTSTSCETGRWPFQIEVKGNVVSAIEPMIFDGEDQGAGYCLPDAMIGSGLTGVGNGVYRGEIVVRDSPK